jgi:hypothetical protein
MICALLAEVFLPVDSRISHKHLSGVPFEWQPKSSLSWFRDGLINVFS